MWFSVVRPFVTILLASSSGGPPNNNYERLISRFEMAYEIAKEADDIIAVGVKNTSNDKNDDGNKKTYQDVISLYEEAIMLGRKPAVSLYELQQEQQEENEFNSNNPLSSYHHRTLEWLIDLYCKSASAKLKINDTDGARGEAWAACVFSQNGYLPALQCMENVCEASDDIIGQINALKQILELVNKNEEGQDSNVEGQPSLSSTFIPTAQEKEDMVKRLQTLEEKL